MEELTFSDTAGLFFEATKCSSHFLTESGKSLLTFCATFPPILPAEVALVVAPEAAATPAVPAANAKDATPTAAVDTTVAAAAFCGGGTHTLVVMLDVSS